MGNRQTEMLAARAHTQRIGSVDDPATGVATSTRRPAAKLVQANQAGSSAVRLIATATRTRHAPPVIKAIFMKA